MRNKLDAITVIASVVAIPIFCLIVLHMLLSGREEDTFDAIALLSLYIILRGNCIFLCDKLANKAL
jgi:hypothetical protein